MYIDYLAFKIPFYYFVIDFIEFFGFVDISWYVPEPVGTNMVASVEYT